MEGTYQYGVFKDNKKELERLLKQAQIALAFERKVLQSCGLSEGMKTIDVGCGPGITAREMARMVGKANVLGVDANEKLLDIARLYKEEEKVENLDFELQDVYNLTPSEKDFDFAYSRFLFQHLKTPVEALKQIASVMRPGGHIVVADIDDQFLTIYPENKSFDRIKREAAQGQAACGGNRFIGRALPYYARDAGLKNINIQTVTITSLDLGLKNFLNITMDFKAEQIREQQMKKTELKRALEELRTLNEEKYIGIVAVFLLTAEV